MMLLNDLILLRMLSNFRSFSSSKLQWQHSWQGGAGLSSGLCQPQCLGHTGTQHAHLHCCLLAFQACNDLFIKSLCWPERSVALWLPQAHHPKHIMSPHMLYGISLRHIMSPHRLYGCQVVSISRVLTGSTAYHESSQAVRLPGGPQRPLLVHAQAAAVLCAHRATVLVHAQAAAVLWVHDHADRPHRRSAGCGHQRGRRPHRHWLSGRHGQVGITVACVLVQVKRFTEPFGALLLLRSMMRWAIPAHGNHLACRRSRAGATRVSECACCEWMCMLWVNVHAVCLNVHAVSDGLGCLRAQAPHRCQGSRWRCLAAQAGSCAPCACQGTAYTRPRIILEACNGSCMHAWAGNLCVCLGEPARPGSAAPAVSNVGSTGGGYARTHTHTHVPFSLLLAHTAQGRCVCACACALHVWTMCMGACFGHARLGACQPPTRGAFVWVVPAWGATR